MKEENCDRLVAYYACQRPCYMYFFTGNNILTECLIDLVHILPVAVLGLRLRTKCRLSIIEELI